MLSHTENSCPQGCVRVPRRTHSLASGRQHSMLSLFVLLLLLVSARAMKSTNAQEFEREMCLRFISYGKENKFIYVNNFRIKQLLENHWPDRCLSYKNEACAKATKLNGKCSACGRAWLQDKIKFPVDVGKIQWRCKKKHNIASGERPYDVYVEFETPEQLQEVMKNLMAGVLGRDLEPKEFLLPKELEGGKCFPENTKIQLQRVNFSLRTKDSPERKALSRTALKKKGSNKDKTGTAPAGGQPDAVLLQPVGGQVLDGRSKEQVTSRLQPSNLPPVWNAYTDPDGREFYVKADGRGGFIAQFNRPELECAGCKQRASGWTGPNRKFYCEKCWKAWNEFGDWPIIKTKSA